MSPSIRVNPITARPTITTTRQGTTLTISWTAGAAGFILESTPTLGAGANWTPVAGTPNPLTGAGSANINTASGAGFYRLRKP